MSTPLLIGLSGKKRRGKDTLGAALIEDYGFKRFGFADALKQAALDVNPYVSNEDRYEFKRLGDVYAEFGSFEELKFSPWNNSVRELLQQLGSVMAIRDNNFWSGPVVAEALKHIKATGDGAVITDVRFPWEVNMVRNSGCGVMVRVFRSDLPDDPSEDGHISETMLDSLVPELYFDTSPWDATFSVRVGVMLERLMVKRVADSSLLLGGVRSGNS